MNSSISSCNVLSLPHEILIETFRYLTLPELVTVKLTCSYLYHVANDKSFISSWWYSNIAGPIPENPHLWLKNYQWEPAYKNSECSDRSEHIMADLSVIESKLGILSLYFDEQPIYEYDGREIDPEINAIYHQALANLRLVDSMLSAKTVTNNNSITGCEYKMAKFLERVLDEFNVRNPDYEYSLKTIAMIAAPINPESLNLKKVSKQKKKILSDCHRENLCFAIYLHSEHSLCSDGQVPIAVMGLKDNFVKILIVDSYGTYGTITRNEIVTGRGPVFEYEYISSIRQSTIPYAAKLGLNHKCQLKANWHPIAGSEVDKNISPYVPNLDIRVRDYYSLCYFIKYLAKYGYYFNRNHQPYRS